MSTPGRTAVTGPYLRTTVLTEQHRLDVVLPTVPPVSQVLSAVLDLLEAPEASTLSMLHTEAGQALDPRRSLAEAGLRDGVVLRLVAVREAPAEPLVADLIDVFEAADVGLGRAGAAGHRRLCAGAGAALIVLGCAGVAALTNAVVLMLVLAAAALWSTAILAGLRGEIPVRDGLGVGGLTLVVFALAVLDADSPARAGWALIAALVAVVVFGAATKRWRATVFALPVLGGAGLMAMLAWLLSADIGITGAVSAVLAVVISGLLPHGALAVSGAFSLDGRIQRGSDVRSRQAHEDVAEANRTLCGALAATCLVFGVSASFLALSAPGQPWATALIVVLMVLWLCRLPHLPTTTQRVLVLIAAAGPGVVVLVAAQRSTPSAVPWICAVSLGLGVMLLVSYRHAISPLLAAKARRWLRRLEVVAVLTTLPALVGFLGVYTDLIATF